jgi:hypothetical protein
MEKAMNRFSQLCTLEAKPLERLQKMMTDGDREGAQEYILALVESGAVFPNSPWNNMHICMGVGLKKVGLLWATDQNEMMKVWKGRSVVQIPGEIIDWIGWSGIIRPVIEKSMELMTNRWGIIHGLLMAAQLGLDAQDPLARKAKRYVCEVLFASGDFQDLYAMRYEERSPAKEIDADTIVDWMIEEAGYTMLEVYQTFMKWIRGHELNEFNMSAVLDAKCFKYHLKGAPKPF